MSFFTDKVVWITGASSGIGEALVYALSEKKARLIISARRIEELQRVKDNCKFSSHNIVLLPLDLSKVEELSAKANEAIAVFGKIDFLFNNGGISQRALAGETPMELDRKIMEVNYFSHIAITKTLLPFMVKQGRGNIIVTSSVNGQCALPLRSAYAASKHALHGFFEALREEHYKDNIKVLMVLPGFIKTNLSLNAITKDGNAFNQMGHGQQKGLQAIDFAHKLLVAIEKDKKEVYIGGKDILILYIKRFLPALYYKIIRKVKTV